MFKNKCSIMLLILAIFTAKCDLVYGQEIKNVPPDITAKSAIVVDIDSCSVLYSKNQNELLYPASTTKVLTCILGLEMGNMDDIVEISPQASKVGEASIHLHAYDEIKLYDLIKGALIKSGNDAAFAVGEYIAGKENYFVHLMNKKAFLLGCCSSNFCNTNGLPNDEHICTAYDLAVIAKYAMHNKLFSTIVSTKSDTIKFLDGEKRYLKNTNKLLWKYDSANGVKTGTTRKAGSCLIASASKDNKNYLVVILKSLDRYGDAEKLFEYAFDNFNVKYYPKGYNLGEIYVKNGEKTTAEIVTVHEIAAVCKYNELDKFEIKLNIPNYINANAFEGIKVGNVNFLLNGNILDSSPVIVKDKIKSISFFNKLKKLIDLTV